MCKTPFVHSMSGRTRRARPTLISPLLPANLTMVPLSDLIEPDILSSAAVADPRRMYLPSKPSDCSRPANAPLFGASTVTRSGPCNTPSRPPARTFSTNVFKRRIRGCRIEEVMRCELFIASGRDSLIGGGLFLIRHSRSLSLDSDSRAQFLSGLARAKTELLCSIRPSTRVLRPGEIYMNSTETRPFAVVTGASSGIGYELASQFVQHGYDVLIAAEDEGIRQAAQRLAANGNEIEPLQVDLATYEGVERLAEKIRSSNRPVEALALNAGVGVSGDFATGTDLADELNLIQLNVLSPVHLAKRVLPGMVARGEGRVLITSSIAGTMPGPSKPLTTLPKRS